MVGVSPSRSIYALCAEIRSYYSESDALESSHQRVQLPYSSGDVFAVPLRTSGYGTGLIAGADGRGGVIGYFFGPKRNMPIATDEASLLSPTDALRVMRFGDLGLLGQTTKPWVLVGQLQRWSSSEWPIPDFCRQAADGRYIKVSYGTQDLSRPTAEEEISMEACNNLPRDVLSGAGAVELILTQLLGEHP